MCAQEFSAEVFLLQSPGFPEDYPPESTCEFHIRRKSPRHCRIEMKVISFDLEEGSDGKCEADYLEFTSGFKLCGTKPKDHTGKMNFKMCIFKLNVV